METTETHSGLHGFASPFPECQTEHINKQIRSFRELLLETVLAEAVEETHTILTPQIIRNPHRPSLFHSDFDNFDQYVNDLSGVGSIDICHEIMLQNISSEPAADESITDNTSRHGFYFLAKMVASKTICIC